MTLADVTLADVTLADFTLADVTLAGFTLADVTLAAALVLQDDAPTSALLMRGRHTSTASVLCWVAYPVLLQAL